MDDECVGVQLHGHDRLEPYLEGVLSFLAGEIVVDKCQTLVPYSLILLLHDYVVCLSFCCVCINYAFLAFLVSRCKVATFLSPSV